MVKITIAQIKPKLGDLEHNAAKILEFYNSAGGDAVLFPEMSLCGYLPRDLLLRSRFIENCRKKLLEVLPHIGSKICIIGLPLLREGRLFNAMVVLQNGGVLAESLKTHLPNYDVFDERRYFAPGEPAIFEYKGVRFGLPICEDIWERDVCKNLKLKGVELMLVANASPFSYEKTAARLEVARARFGETQIPMIYCNQVLCQDGIIYEGGSFAFDGKSTIFADSFKEDVLELRFYNGKFEGRESKILSADEVTYEALVFGLKEYVLNSGFEKVVLGLSGGADSALTLVLAVKAFGAAGVVPVLMPSRFTSNESLKDAKELAKNLGTSLREISIEPMLKAFSACLPLGGSAFENIQARIRGNILMAISNQEGALVLTTGNKSEVAVGYCTIYGDMCGAYNPIKDLYKTQVFEVMRYINKTGIAKIPQNIITKAPSAELRPNQKDIDSLPGYDVLDKILYEFIENKKLPEEVKSFAPEVVGEIWRLLQTSEYKRRQAAPGTKLSKQSFEPSEWRNNAV